MAGVRIGQDGAVRILTLDDPQTLNAMTPQMLGALRSAIAEASDDPQVRCLLLTGAGRGFCSGQNLKGGDPFPGGVLEGVMTHYWPAFRAIRECTVPVVAAVNGVAAGGGCSLALACDMVVAARSASFIQVFSRIALVPDLGSTWLLPRLIGRQRALEMMLLNEPLDAERARDWGIVREVFEDDRLHAGALALAARLAAGPTRTLVETRRLVDEAEHASYEAQFRRELEVQQEVRASADALEGRAAFVERRAPRFSGR